MDHQDITRQALLRKSNLIVFALAYLAVGIPISQVIFEPGNLAAPDTISKILLLSVVLLVFAPFVAIWTILFRLRFEQAIKDKDLMVLLFLTPVPKGSWGNPNIASLFSEKGRKFLGRLRIFLYVLVILMLVGFPIWMGIELIFNK